MERHKLIGNAGYYLITLRAKQLGPLLRSNTERALIISVLQDTLTSRSILEVPLNSRLSVAIDLLGFSILKEGIQLIVFTIEDATLRILTDKLLLRLREYRSDYLSPYSVNESQYPLAHFESTYRQLAGPHDALQASLQIHLNHLDWEFDRYSSIGFYLHDRRGDWIRLWRLTSLYENDPERYYDLLDNAMHSFQLDHTCRFSASLPYATSVHA